MTDLQSIQDDIMNIFYGLRTGLVDYSYDNLNCAMKTNICEVFSSVAEEVAINVELGREVTKEQLQKLHDNLISFAKEYKVKEAKALAGKVKELLEG